MPRGDLQPKIQIAAIESPPAPWKFVQNQKQEQKWIRRLDGEEIWMTWQEVHQKGFMVLTAGFALQHQEINFDQFVQRIKDGWIEMRKSLPMLGCKFVPNRKTGDYFAVEYDVPNTHSKIQLWSDKTVIVKRNGEYDFEKETEKHPDRPDHHVAMLRILEEGGHHIDQGEEQHQKERNHLVLFTVSHAMADIYTLCDVGRLLLESLCRDNVQHSHFIWGTEISSLPTSLTGAYKHFIGRRSSTDKRKSARYWGEGILPMLKKDYCSLPINDQTEGIGSHGILSRLSIEESAELLLFCKERKISLTAITYGALALELELLSNRNGTNHCVGIVRNNRRFFPVPLKHEFKASPAPAGTMSFIEIPLSPMDETCSPSSQSSKTISQSSLEEELQEANKSIDFSSNLSYNKTERQKRILHLANSFAIALKSHTEGSAADLGLANIDALTKPYTALLQHNTAALLSWLPRIWSTKTIANVIRSSHQMSERKKNKPPPLTMSAHGNLDELLPNSSKSDPLAKMNNYQLFTRPGENTIAVLTYTFRGQFHMRIVHNTKFYNPSMIDNFVQQSMAHLRSFTNS